jgi:hypothetical protein
MVWSLNSAESKIYISDEKFRRDLMERMKLPCKQLQLQLHGNTLDVGFQINWKIPYFPSIYEV